MPSRTTRPDPRRSRPRRRRPAGSASGGGVEAGRERRRRRRPLVRRRRRRARAAGSRRPRARGPASAWVPGRSPPNGPGARTPRRARTAASARGRRTSTPRRRWRTRRRPGRPGATRVTSAPTASTMPDGLVPEHAPGVVGVLPCRKCRSEPQIAARVTRTTASVGASSAGIGHVGDLARAGLPRSTTARISASSGNRVGTSPQRTTSSCAACT